MENKDQNSTNNNERKAAANPGEMHSSIPNDLPDNAHDKERLESEETTLDLPDVADIPGQEFVNAPPLGAMADTTISSDDEEGREIFNDFEDEEDVDLVMGTKGDVKKDERKALEDVNYMPTRDEDNLRRAALDNTDFDGVPLNEGSFGEKQTGKDLDVPGESLDDENEKIGEEDEENNEYSLGSGDNDSLENKS